jgi:hypothetical protein
MNVHLVLMMLLVLLLLLLLVMVEDLIGVGLKVWFSVVVMVVSGYMFLKLMLVNKIWQWFGVVVKIMVLMLVVLMKLLLLLMMGMMAGEVIFVKGGVKLHQWRWLRGHFCFRFH